MPDKTQSIVETVRVAKLACIRCQHVMDVSHLPSFAPIKCPACGIQQIVPAKFGSFLLLSQLGSGGMGVIYHGVDRELGRHVALKVMKRSLGDNQEFVRSFKHEAQAAAAFNHRNVVQIYSFGQVEGQPYIVMELVDGGRLDEMIADGPLAETRALEIHLEVTDGLHAASQVGLVHGDIKPANILFGRSGEAKVVDFGLASFIGQQQQQGGQVWGTPYYIAPEKARGKKVDFRSDIYSLGATLFHALVGQPPFDGPTPVDVVMARLKQPAPGLLTLRADLHPPTASMVARMLEAEPTMRYPSYQALLVEMREALEASRAPRPGSISAGFAGAVGKQVGWLRSVPWMKIGIAVAMAAAFVTAGGWGIWSHKQRTQVATAELDQAALQAARERGRDISARADALTQTIVKNAEPLLLLAPQADNLGRMVPETETAMIELRELVERVQTALNEVEDRRALAQATYQALAAIPNARAAQAQADRLDALSADLVEHYNAIEEVKELAPDILKAVTVIYDRAHQAAAVAQQAADRAAARQREEETARQRALQQAQEAARRRPMLIQRELDLVDEARAANAPLILRRQFDAAAKAIARIQPDLTLGESKAYYRAVTDAYRGMDKMKAFIVKSISAAPYPNGWVAGDATRDIVEADADQGIMIALGSAGKMLTPWDQVSVQQMLKITQHYLNVPGLPEKECAEVLLGAALFCYESGLFKTAESGATAAARKDPAIKDEINRLMPGLGGEP